MIHSLADAASGFNNSELGTWVLILFAVASGIGGVAGIIALFRPQPALHKQFADRADHDKDIAEIKTTLGEMREEFSDWSRGHYDARRRMHNKIGHLTNALTYLAGTLAKSDPGTATMLRDILAKTEEEGL